MNIANFEVDKEKCVGCEKCVKVCPGGLLHLDEHRNPVIADVSEFGWNGCWQCGHCLSVCPKDAVLLTFPLGVLERMPDIKAKLQIPDYHYIGMVIGFGYPEIHYARGTQRDIAPDRVHRLQFDLARRKADAGRVVTL